MNAGDINNAQIDDGGGLFELFQVAAENLRLLIVLPVAVGVVAFATAFLITPTYIATATFLPPQQQQGLASSILQSIGGAGSLPAAAAGLKDPTEQFISFLRSNSVQDSLVKRFDLMSRYDVRFKSDARNALEKNTRIKSGKDNILTIDFEDTDPKFAAALANAYGEELAKLLGRLAITEAQQRRLFFGKQLASTKEALIVAEKNLAATGVSVAALNANPSTALEGPARLRAQVTAQEVKLASMRSYLTETAPDYRQASAELSALRKELIRAESVQPTTAATGGDYIAKFREFKYQETLFEQFSRQYELARIDESREGALMQVVDFAQVPEHKAKPKKAIIAIVAAISTGLLVLVFVFARHSFGQARSGEAEKKMKKLRATLRRSLGVRD
ncbi:lipopolysaccharide biosynthesis protein [Xylophilus sp. Kf1]|nr:lipopolysaccharide biosynthesis protein [Xylophilus sp. Kf1]